MVLNCPITSSQGWVPNTAEPVSTQIIWPLDTDLCACSIDPVDDRFYAVAVDLLWRKTCKRFAICTTRIRPCTKTCSCGKICDGGCDWQRYDLSEHVAYPIISVDGVKIDGVAIAATEYEITNGGKYLVPLKADATALPPILGVLWCWPPQDLNVPDGAAGTWSVDVTVGEMPGPALLFAAVDLACQLAKSCAGEVCDVPENAVSVTRDGVTVRLETGLLAVKSVKMALDAYPCPKGRRSRMLDPSEWFEASEIPVPVAP